MAKANYHIRRKCPICGTIFEIRTIDAVYCSHNCSAVASKRKKAQEEKEKKYEQMAECEGRKCGAGGRHPEDLRTDRGEK